MRKWRGNYKKFGLILLLGVLLVVTTFQVTHAVSVVDVADYFGLKSFPGPTSCLSVIDINLITIMTGGWMILLDGLVCVLFAILHYLFALIFFICSMFFAWAVELVDPQALLEGITKFAQINSIPNGPGGTNIISSLLFGSTNAATLQTAFATTGTLLTQPYYIQIWRNSLNFVNGIVAVILLLIAFAEMLHININTYGIKKRLPALIFAVVAANFSLLFCRLAIDFAKVLIGYFSGADGFMKNMGNLYPNFIAGGFLQILPMLVRLIYAILLCVVMLILAIIYMFRRYFLLGLSVISPIFFLAMALPQTDKWFKWWFDNFIKWAFAPVWTVIILFLGKNLMDIMGVNVFPIMDLIFGVVILAGAIWSPFKFGALGMSAMNQAFDVGWKHTGGAAIERGKSEGLSRLSQWNAEGQEQATNRPVTGVGKREQLTNALQNAGSWAHNTALRGTRGVTGMVQRGGDGKDNADKRAANYWQQSKNQAYYQRNPDGTIIYDPVTNKPLLTQQGEEIMGAKKETEDHAVVEKTAREDIEKRGADQNMTDPEAAERNRQLADRQKILSKSLETATNNLDALTKEQLHTMEMTGRYNTLMSQANVALGRKTLGEETLASTEKEELQLHKQSVEGQRQERERAKQRRRAGFADDEVKRLELEAKLASGGTVGNPATPNAAVWSRTLGNTDSDTLSRSRSLSALEMKRATARDNRGSARHMRYATNTGRGRAAIRSTREFEIGQKGAEEDTNEVNAELVSQQDAAQRGELEAIHSASLRTKGWQAVSEGVDSDADRVAHADPTNREAIARAEQLKIVKDTNQSAIARSDAEIEHMVQDGNHYDGTPLDPTDPLDAAVLAIADPTANGVLWDAQMVNDSVVKRVKEQLITGGKGNQLAGRTTKTAIKGEILANEEAAHAAILKRIAPEEGLKAKDEQTKQNALGQPAIDPVTGEVIIDPTTGLPLAETDTQRSVRLGQHYQNLATMRQQGTQTATGQVQGFQDQRDARDGIIQQTEESRVQADAAKQSADEEKEKARLRALEDSRTIIQATEEAKIGLGQVKALQEEVMSGAEKLAKRNSADALRETEQAKLRTSAEKAWGDLSIDQAQRVAKEREKYAIRQAERAKIRGTEEKAWGDLAVGQEQRIAKEKEVKHVIAQNRAQIRLNREKEFGNVTDAIATRRAKGLESATITETELAKTRGSIHQNLAKAVESRAINDARRGPANQLLYGEAHLAEKKAELDSQEAAKAKTGVQNAFIDKTGVFNTDASNPNQSFAQRAEITRNQLMSRTAIAKASEKGASRRLGQAMGEFQQPQIGMAHKARDMATLQDLLAKKDPRLTSFMKGTLTGPARDSFVDQLRGLGVDPAAIKDPKLLWNALKDRVHEINYATTQEIDDAKAHGRDDIASMAAVDTTAGFETREIRVYDPSTRSITKKKVKVPKKVDYKSWSEIAPEDSEKVLTTGAERTYEDVKIKDQHDDAAEGKTRTKMEEIIAMIEGRHPRGYSMQEAEMFFSGAGELMDKTAQNRILEIIQSSHTAARPESEDYQTRLQMYIKGAKLGGRFEEAEDRYRRAFTDGKGILRYPEIEVNGKKTAATFEVALDNPGQEGSAQRKAHQKAFTLLESQIPGAVGGLAKPIR